MLISKNKKSVKQFGIKDTLVYLIPEFCIMTGITEAMRCIFFINVVSFTVILLLEITDLFITYGLITEIIFCL